MLHKKDASYLVYYFKGGNMGLLLFIMLLLMSVLPIVISIGILKLNVWLTIKIEKPIIIQGDITDNEKYIKAVNTVTNVVYNIILLYFTTAVGNFVALVIYTLLSELIIIPLVETFAYKKMSSKPFGTILKCSYKANLLSALAGVLIEVGFFFIISISPI